MTFISRITKYIIGGGTPTTENNPYQGGSSPYDAQEPPHQQQNNTSSSSHYYTASSSANLTPNANQPSLNSPFSHQSSDDAMSWNEQMGAMVSAAVSSKYHHNNHVPAAHPKHRSHQESFAEYVKRSSVHVQEHIQQHGDASPLLSKKRNSYSNPSQSILHYENDSQLEYQPMPKHSSRHSSSPSPLQQSPLYFTNTGAPRHSFSPHSNADIGSYLASNITSSTQLPSSSLRHSTVQYSTPVLKQHARYMELAKSKLPAYGKFSEIIPLMGHENPVTQLIKIDEERVLSYSEDGSLIIWQVHTGRILRRLQGHRNKVTCALIMQVSSSSSTPTTSSNADAPSTEHSYQQDSTMRGATFSQHTHSPQQAATNQSPTSSTHNAPKKLSITVDTNHLSSTAATPSTPPSVTNQHSPLGGVQQRSGPHYSPLSQSHHFYQHTSTVPTQKSVRIISGSVDKTVRIWDADTGACLHVLKAASHSAVNVLTKLNRTQFCSVSDEICVWNVASGAQVGKSMERSDSEHVHDVISLPNHRLIVASWSLTVYNIQHPQEDMEPKQLEKQDDDVFFLKKLTPETFVSASRNGILSFWNSYSFQCLEKLDLRQYFHKDDNYQLTCVNVVNRLFLACALGKNFVVIHHPSRKAVLIRDNAHETTINQLIFLSRGHRNFIVSCADDARIRLWRTQQSMNLLHNSSTPPTSVGASHKRLHSAASVYNKKKQHSHGSESKMSLFSRRTSRKRSRSMEESQPVFYSGTDILMAKFHEELCAHTEPCVDVLKLNDCELLSAGGNDVILWRDGAVSQCLRKLYSWRFSSVTSS